MCILCLHYLRDGVEGFQQQRGWPRREGKMMMSKFEAAKASVLEAIKMGSTFIIPSFVSDQYGRAVSSKLFRELDMAAHGYEKRGSVYIKVGQ